MEIIEIFGLNPILLLAQIVNFLIVFFILKKLLYKPFLSTLKKREESIRDGLKQADEGRRILEEATQKEKEILRQAQYTSDKLIKDAKAQAGELAAQIEENAKKQSEKMLIEAREQITQEAKQSEERLVKHIGEIAVAVLEKTLSSVMDRKEKSEIIKRVSAHIDDK